MNDAKRRAIFERLREANPKPTTELDHRSPFELLVAVVLSAQSTDKGVNKATANLFPVANTPQAIVALGVEGLTPYISSLGLYRNKAKSVVGLSAMLVQQHGGQVPADRESLEQLPGVGRKTANVILNTAFGQPTIAVDTHMFRVANRTGLAPGKDVLEVERKLDATVPDEFKHNAHHWLILHGRYVCVARVPKCPECVIRPWCEYPAKTGEPTAARVAAKASAVAKGAKPHVVPKGGRRPTVASRGKPATSKPRATGPMTRVAQPQAKGVQPMAKTARAGARRGRAR